MSISELPVKSLVKILTDLCGGHIGFDPYRDERTNKKEKLLAFILNSYSNDQIIAAVTRFQSAEMPEKLELTEQWWEVRYRDPMGVAHKHLADTEFEADAFIRCNPMHQYLGKFKMPAVEKQAIAPSVQDTVSPQQTQAKPKPAATPVTTGTEAEQIAALLASLASKGKSVDIETVRAEVTRQLSGEAKALLEIVDAKLATLQAPLVVHVKNQQTQEIKNLGVQHVNFPDLLIACQAYESPGRRMNIWLHGPAGTGKTHAAHAVADALGLPFQSNGTLLTEHSLSGFIDAHGKYHGTAFREIFEHGGVYLGDEYDVWNPKAAMWLQAALANGYTRFPDGMVKRHENCVIIFGANTTGKGATSDYSTRNKVDDANANRVVFIDWPLDETLETAISSNPAWTKRVQQFRKKVEERKLKGHMITPRQSMQGAGLLAAGMSEDKVITAVLRRGLSDDQWAGLC